MRISSDTRFTAADESRDGGSLPIEPNTDFGDRTTIVQQLGDLDVRIKWTIARKLGLALVICVAPVAFSLSALVREINISIDFAEKEVVGGRLIEALRAAQFAVHRHSTDSIAGATQMLQEHREEFVDILGSADATGALLADLSNLASDGVDQDRRVSAMQKVRDLITQVGDSSNLILDPDLDSFYVMDAVLVKSPDATDQIMSLYALARAVAAKKSLSVED